MGEMVVAAAATVRRTRSHFGLHLADTESSHAGGRVAVTAAVVERQRELEPMAAALASPMVPRRAQAQSAQ